MNNAYYVLAKTPIAVERLHICTWEFPRNPSYIEFGLEFSYKCFDDLSLQIWLSVPFIKEGDEVKCLLENLSDRANSRFIFNDIVTGIDNIGADYRDGNILKFESREPLTILPCEIEVSKGLVILTVSKPSKHEGNIYIRVKVKHDETIAIKKSGIAKNSYTYDLKINETRNLPQEIYELKKKKHLQICKINTLFCLHSVPDNFDFCFIDTSKLKNIRKLECDAFKRYLPDVKDIGKDCYNIMFLKDRNRDSYSLFTVCSEETIGTKQIAFAIGANILCNILFSAYSIRVGWKNDLKWYTQMPWEGLVSLLILLGLIIYLYKSSKK